MGKYIRLAENHKNRIFHAEDGKVLRGQNAVYFEHPPSDVLSALNTGFLVEMSESAAVADQEARAAKAQQSAPVSAAADTGQNDPDMQARVEELEAKLAEQEKAHADELRALKKPNKPEGGSNK